MGSNPQPRPVEREVEYGGKLPRSLRRFGSPADAQKYKITPEFAILKEKFKNFLPREFPQACFPRPRCGSGRTCPNPCDATKSKRV